MELRDKEPITMYLYTEEDEKKGIKNLGEKLRIMEHEHQKTIAVSDEELLKMFPDSKDVIVRNIGDFESEKAMLLEGLRTKYKTLEKELPQDQQWATDELIKISPEARHMAVLDKRLARLRRFLPLLFPKKNTNKPKVNFGKLIEQAKQVPIEDVAIQHLEKVRRMGDKIMASCPFHEDHTPSFCIYITSGTYHCFGCLVHGDVISFTQKVNNLSFKEAVYRLTNTYGKSTAN